MKRILLGISGGVSLIICLILLAVSGHLAGKLPEQQMAQRWSEEKDVAQVSCFFSVDSGVTEDTIMGFRHTLDSVLQEASITQESENPSARLWVDAYSANGELTLSNGNKNLKAHTIGIGGDFFLFHPLRLITGSYFSGNDLMQDYCVIDEDAAWQLFGSNDVAGRIVYILDIPHIITGVVERPSGRLAESAGLETTVVYVSYDSLSRYGITSGINHYEIVMPNPVKNFAAQTVQERIGVEEGRIEVLENTSRYALGSRIGMLGEFGTRSMNGKAIIYPYWENMARGYEDIIGLLTVFAVLFLLYPAILFTVLFISRWRHKNWTVGQIWHRLRDRWEDHLEQRREEKGLVEIKHVLAQKEAEENEEEML